MPQTMSRNTSWVCSPDKTTQIKRCWKVGTEASMTYGRVVRRPLEIDSPDLLGQAMVMLLLRHLPGGKLATSTLHFDLLVSLVVSGSNHGLQVQNHTQSLKINFEPQLPQLLK